MKYICHLSMDNPELAQAELEAVIPDITIDDSLDGALVWTTSASPSQLKELATRLAYTQSIGQVLVHTPTFKFLDALRQVPWKTLYKESFWVTVEKKHRTNPITTPDVAKIIAAALTNPKGNAESPSLHVFAYITEKNSVASIPVYQNDKTFNERKPQHRPAFHPASINPKLARALVNLSGISKGVVLDPFCGVGGILIEAGLMGLYCKGADISTEMIEKAQTNLDHYKITRYSLTKHDATTLEESADVIVTDLPYGRSTKSISPTLYKEFLKHARILVRTAVVVFPSTTDVDKEVEETGWKIEARYNYYMHRSLSKIITVLKRV